MKKYRARIVREGALKALSLGLVCGSTVLALCTFFSWLFGFKEGLWLGLALFLLITASVALPLYFLKYKPTAKQVAARVDALGLNERVLTMTELEGDESCIARLQREDTERSLGKLDHMMLKIALSAALCVGLCIALLFGIGGTTVNALYHAGVIPGGMELFAKITPLPIYKVTYSVQDKTDGSICLWDESWGEPVYISDEDVYEVEEGEAAPAVYALDGAQSVFIGWSDGLATRYRKDDDIGRDVSVIALYTSIEDEEVPPDDEMLEEEDQNGGGMPGDGEGAGGNEPGEDGLPEGDEGDPDSTQGGGGNSVDNQQIVDGETYYGDRYNDAYNDALDRFGSDEQLPEDLKEWIADYYNSIEKNESSKQDSDDKDTNNE